MSKLQHRVALVTVQDPTDVRSWSGTQYHIYQQLKKRFAVVDPVGPVKLNVFERLLVKVVHKVFRKLFPKYNHIHSTLNGYLRARHFSRRIRKGNYSMVFASASSPVVAFLRTPLPIVYLSDATFHLLVDYYEQFTGLSRFSLYEGEFVEGKAIAKSAAVVMSSEWARQSAITDYGANPDKVEVCPFGANTDVDTVGHGQPHAEKISSVGEECHLLFLARDWRRKGGQVALDAFRKLKQQGYNVTLTVCGCVPEHEQSMEGLTVIPYLDKGKEEDRRRYHEIMSRSHFLVLPTVADCTPMVFAEANAYGMPVLSTDTGGVASIIHPGVNGYLLPERASGEDYASVVEHHFFEQPEEYRRLVQSSRNRYEQALTWDKWGKRIEEVVERHLAVTDYRPAHATVNAKP